MKQITVSTVSTKFVNVINPAFAGRQALKRLLVHTLYYICLGVNLYQYKWEV